MSFSADKIVAIYTMSRSSQAKTPPLHLHTHGFRGSAVILGEVLELGLADPAEEQEARQNDQRIGEK